MTYGQARAGIHAAVRSERNRRRLRAIRRKYARYDREHRDTWWLSIWCALWLGWTVAREVMRHG